MSCASTGVADSSKAAAIRIFRWKAEATELIAPEYTAAPWTRPSPVLHVFPNAVLHVFPNPVLHVFPNPVLRVFRLPSSVFRRW